VEEEVAARISPREAAGVAVRISGPAVEVGVAARRTSFRVVEEVAMASSSHQVAEAVRRLSPSVVPAALEVLAVVAVLAADQDSRASHWTAPPWTVRRRH
jgi:hypothetical protein